VGKEPGCSFLFQLEYVRRAEMIEFFPEKQKFDRNYRREGKGD